MVCALTQHENAAGDQNRHQRKAEPEFLSHLVRFPHDVLVELLNILVLDVHHLFQLVDIDFLDVLLA